MRSALPLYSGDLGGSTKFRILRFFSLNQVEIFFNLIYSVHVCILSSFCWLQAFQDQRHLLQFRQHYHCADNKNTTTLFQN